METPKCAHCDKPANVFLAVAGEDGWYACFDHSRDPKPTTREVS